MPAVCVRIRVKVRAIIAPELGIPDSVRSSADDGYDAQDRNQAQKTVVGRGRADVRTLGIRDEARFRFDRIWRHWIYSAIQAYPCKLHDLRSRVVDAYAI